MRQHLKCWIPCVLEHSGPKWVWVNDMVVENRIVGSLSMIPSKSPEAVVHGLNYGKPFGL